MALLNPLDHLRCVVERITYQNEGYSVLKCAAKGYTDLVTVVGTMPDTHIGSVLTLGGNWKMQIRNNYDKEVFNGDIGTVVSIEDRTMMVAFDDRTVEYDASELDELVLAYATTVHKAQGAEYPVVVMPVMMTHFVMLQRNLIYTGVKRAKKGLVLVGEKKAIAYCIRNVTVDKRNTLLAERMMGKV